MTREEAKRAAEVMLAYANGETIECRRKGGNDWFRCAPPDFNLDEFEFRIKPQLKTKFDPKSLKPFDRVLVRDSGKELWTCVLFSHHTTEVYSFVCDPYVCGNTSYVCCIPYNDDTKHLVGTYKEAPEYYRYWED